MSNNRQTDATSIGKKTQSLSITPQFSGFTKVMVNVTEELYYEAGTDIGETLELDCPWGTQAVADSILASLLGYQYQPYEATGARLDPAAELGDGLTVNSVYGGIFKMKISASPLHVVDVSAPAEEEIEHEYKFVSKTERKIERRLADVQSELSIQSDQISAKVDATGGSPSSVSWVLNGNTFKVMVNGSPVLTVTTNGLTVNGDGTFTGSVSAKNIQHGGSHGTFSGSGISGSSIGTGKLTSGINGSLSNADYSADVFSGSATAQYTTAKNLIATGKLNVKGVFAYQGTNLAVLYRQMKDANGNTFTQHYMGF